MAPDLAPRCKQRYVMGWILWILTHVDANSVYASAGKHPLIIAHRGASGYVAEHTLVAIAMAHAMGADYIEPDVVLSKDGVPIVLHDLHLELTTNAATAFPTRQRKDGHWYAIDFTLSELRTLIVHERLSANRVAAAFPQRFPHETTIFSIPTLDEMILLVQGLNRSTGRRVGIYPELKAPAFHQQAGFDIAQIVLELLKRRGYERRVDPIFVQCFDPNTLRHIRHHLKSDLRLVQLIADNSWAESSTDYNVMRTLAGLKKVAEYADAIGPWMGHLASEKGALTTAIPPLIQWARKVGLQVHPYTARADALPDGAASFTDFLTLLIVHWKVDGIFTDFPDQMVDFLRQHRS